MFAIPMYSVSSRIGFRFEVSDYACLAPEAPIRELAPRQMTERERLTAGQLGWK